MTDGDEPQVVDLGDGVTLVLEKGSVTAGSTIRHAPVDAAPPEGAEAYGASPMELSVEGGELTGAVRLEFAYDPADVPEGLTAADVFSVVTAEDAGAGWAPVEFTVDEARHRLVVVTTHFSVWDAVAHTVSAAVGWLQQGIGQALGNRAGPPKCGGPGRGAVPAWVAQTVTPDTSNAVIRACAEGEGDLAVIELVNNRKYPMYLRYGAPVAWGWHDEPSSLGDLAISGYLDSLAGPDALYLPPLSRAAIGVPRGSWFYAGFEAAPTRGALGAMIASVALEKLGGGIATATLGNQMGAACLTGYVLGNVQDPVPTEPHEVAKILQSVSRCLANAIRTNGLPSLAGSGASALQLDVAWRSLEVLGAAGIGAEVGGALTPFVDLLLNDPLPATMSIRRRDDGQAPPLTDQAQHPPVPQGGGDPVPPPPVGQPPLPPGGGEPPPPPVSPLVIDLSENPFRCDGVSRPFGMLSGAQPGETVTFSSSDVGGLLPGTADGAGRLALRWQCDPSDAGRSWTVVATGQQSGRTGQFTVTGLGVQQQPPPPPPPPPPKTWRAQQGSRGADTFTNYHNASGKGPRVAAAQWVDVSCKVHDPTILSVNPDGYWYRLASPPWGNQYYAAANTFMNGDPWGGPYTHNTDFSIPDC